MKKMPVRTKNLKAPLGFFLFTDKIKKRENGSQYSVLPKFFANQKTSLVLFKKFGRNFMVSSHAGTRLPIAVHLCKA